MKTMEELWNIVNNAVTLEKIREAKIILDDVGGHISNEEYDDLMNALSYLSREAYREGGV